MRKYVILLSCIISGTVYPKVNLSTSPNTTYFNLTSDHITIEDVLGRARNLQGKIPKDSVLYYYKQALTLVKELPNQDKFLTITLLETAEYCFKNNIPHNFLEKDFLRTIIAQKEVGNAYAQSFLHLQLAKLYTSKPRFWKAMEHTKRALVLARELKDNLLIADCHDLFSEIHMNRGATELAIEQNLKAIRAYRKAREVTTLGASRNRLALLFAKHYKYNKAIIQLNRNLVVKEKWRAQKFKQVRLFGTSGPPVYLPKNNTKEKMLFELYSNLGFLYLLKKEYQTSLFYQKKSLKVLKHHEFSPYEEIIVRRGIGLNYAESGSFEAALEEYKLAIEIAKKRRVNPGFTGTIYLLIASLYEKNNMYEKQLLYLEKYRDLGHEMPQKFNVEYYRLLGATDPKLKKFMLDDRHFPDTKVLTNNIYKIDVASQVLELEKPYIPDYNQQRIKSLAQDNEITQVSLAKVENSRSHLLVLVIGLCIVALIIYRALWRNERLTLELVKKNSLIHEQRNEIAGHLDVEKDLNQRLNKANFSLERFFSIIAHDLRSPFNIMLGYTNILVKNFDSLKPQNVKKYIVTLQKAAQKNYQLTQNLLSWAILQKGGLKVNKKEWNVRQVIDESIAIYQDLAEQKGIVLVNRCPHKLRGHLDKDIAASILSNLVNNALKFTTKNGKVTISAKKMKHHIVFKVDDSGLGMPKRIAKSLFDLSKINSRTGTANETGAGLGLILCKELIHMHEGEIRVKSSVGKGTTVLALL